MLQLNVKQTEAIPWLSAGLPEEQSLLKLCLPQGEEEDAMLSATQLGKILQQLTSPVVLTSDIFIR